MTLKEIFIGRICEASKNTFNLVTHPDPSTITLSHPTVESSAIQGFDWFTSWLVSFFHFHYVILFRFIFYSLY